MQVIDIVSLRIARGIQNISHLYISGIL